MNEVEKNSSKTQMQWFATGLQPIQIWKSTLKTLIERKNSKMRLLSLTFKLSNFPNDCCLILKLCKHFNTLTDFTEKFISTFDISDSKSIQNIFLWNLRCAEIQTKTSDQINAGTTNVFSNYSFLWTFSTWFFRFFLDGVM